MNWTAVTQPPKEPNHNHHGSQFAFYMIIAASSRFSPHQNFGGAIFKCVNEQSRMWEIRVSSHLAFKLKTHHTPDVISFYPGDCSPGAKKATGELL